MAHGALEASLWPSSGRDGGVRRRRDFNLKQETKVAGWPGEKAVGRPYLALLPDGRLLVTDPLGGKVLVFSADAQLAGSYDLPAVAERPAPIPVGIATDGKNVLVADAGADVVRKIPLAEIVK
jgi:hypothetical protein